MTTHTVPSVHSPATRAVRRPALIVVPTGTPPVGPPSMGTARDDGASGPRPSAGGPCSFRELGPGEVDVLLAVFDGLSPASRFRRFHGAVPALGQRMVDRLTDVDGLRHIAVAAFDGGGRPVGIARLIDDGDGRADLAVEVVDAWHGHGVGVRLVRAVAGLGHERGYTQVVAEVLAGNVAVLALLDRVFPVQHRMRSGPEVTVVADLCAAVAIQAVA